MARWQRDTKVRRRLAILLVATEVVALTVCFYVLSGPYVYQVLLRLGLASESNLWAAFCLVIVATAACFGGAVVVGVKYLAGVLWARRAFLIANAVMLALGLVWFIKHEFVSEARSDTTAAMAGLLLPMATLFPLLWPLLTFRPVQEDRQGEGGPDAGP
ncbi:MAG: hypothetical protein ISS74_04365 [Planctomycetes bacterium]|nr:hypothetical protein [Planctomycetota bacterium]